MACKYCWSVTSFHFEIFGVYKDSSFVRDWMSRQIAFHNLWLIDFFHTNFFMSCAFQWNSNCVRLSIYWHFKTHYSHVEITPLLTWNGDYMIKQMYYLHIRAFCNNNLLCNYYVLSLILFLFEVNKQQSLVLLNDKTTLTALQKFFKRKKSLSRLCDLHSIYQQEKVLRCGLTSWSWKNS